MTRLKLALIAQAVLLIYFELIEWVDVFPWNDIRRGNGQESLDVWLTIILIVVFLSTWMRLRLLMLAGVVGYAFWLWLQIESWWLPYFKGASPQWKRTYARFFSGTVNIMPSDGVHLPPDACHLVLQILITLALAASILALLGRPVGRNASADRQPASTAR